MDERMYAKLLNTLTEYDRKQSTKRGYNPYALGHYCGALQRVRRYVDRGDSLRDAILSSFVGRLADTVLKSAGLPKMSDSEARYGLDKPLAALTDENE